MTFLTSCADQTQLARLDANARAEGEIRALTALPDFPEDCRTQLDARIAKGDRLDVALLRTRGYLVQQNDRIARCAEWYDGLKASRD